MANEFLEGRVASATFQVTAQAAATRVPSSVYIPANAIVTGMTMLNTISNVTAAMNQTYAIYAGTEAINAALSLKEIPAVSVVSKCSLLTAAGVFLTSGGMLNLSMGTWDGTSVGNAKPTIYVGYVV
jgi:hypothetical protein